MTGTQLKTNRDAWRVTHDGLDDGLTIGQIAARWDLSRQMVSKWSRMPEPPHEHPIGRQVTGSTARKALRLCERCGESAAYAPNQGSRSVGRWCRPCYTERAVELARVDDRVAALREHAERVGHVPTVSQAREVIGGSRSRAGDLVKLAFGPDPLAGARRTPEGPRAWPVDQ